MRLYDLASKQHARKVSLLNILLAALFVTDCMVEPRAVMIMLLDSIMMVNMSELVQGFKVTVALLGTILAISESEGLPPSSKMKDLGEEHKSYPKSGWCTGFGLKGGSPPTPTETFAPSGSSSEDGEETFAPSGSSSEESEEIDGLDKSFSPPVTIVTNGDRTSYPIS